MRHIIDTKELVSKPILALRKKYGLEAYAIYMIARQLLFLQRLKCLDFDTLIQVMRIHTGKSEVYMVNFLNDCIEYKVLSCYEEDGKKIIYHIDSVVWYLLYCQDRVSRRMSICRFKNDMDLYNETFEKYKDIINMDWSKIYEIQTKRKKNKEKLCDKQ